MKNLVNKGFKYFVAIMMVFSLMSMNAWANGPESGTSSETGSTTTENKGTTKDTGDSQGDTADQLISNEEKKTTTSKESDDKEGQTDQTTDKKTDYTYEDKKISVKAVLANASAISDQAELRVKEIPESTTEYKKYQEALNKKSNLYSNVLLYDISFILDGKEVEPTDGNVKVSMSFKDQQLSDDLNVKDNNDLKVIHFKDNDVNKQELLKTTTSVKNETTSFETKSFSAYAVVKDNGVSKNIKIYEVNNFNVPDYGYGVTAETYNQKAHLETTVFVDDYYSDNQPSIGSTQAYSNAGGYDYIGKISKTSGIINFQQQPKKVYLGQSAYKTYSDNPNILKANGKVMDKRYVEENLTMNATQQIKLMAQQYINAFDNKKTLSENNDLADSISLVGDANNFQNSNDDRNHINIDLTDQNAGSYLVVYDGNFIKQAFNINIKENQRLIFYCTASGSFSMKSYILNTYDDTGKMLKKGTSTEYVANNDSKLDWATEAVSFYMPNITDLEFEEGTCGVFIAPKATFDTRGSSAGVIAVNEFNNSGGEWHYRNHDLPSPDDVQFEGKKSFKDNKWPESGTYNLTLTAKGSAPMPSENRIALSEASPAGKFGKITYPASVANKGKTVSYQYEISEAKGSVSNVVYDSTVYEVKVGVSYGDDGSAIVTGTSYKKYKIDPNGNKQYIDNDWVSFDDGYQFTFTNSIQEEHKLSLQVNKKDSNGQSLNGAIFNLKKDGATGDGETIDTEDKSQASFEKLDPNSTYTLTETKAPTNYKTSGPWKVVTSNEQVSVYLSSDSNRTNNIAKTFDGQNYAFSVDIIDEIKKFGFKLRKKDAAEQDPKVLITNNPATFKLTPIKFINDNKMELDTSNPMILKTTSKNGFVYRKDILLVAGKRYYLEETDPPEGYEKSGPWIIEVNDEGAKFYTVKYTNGVISNKSEGTDADANKETYIITYTVSDHKKYTLPSTGGTGTMKYYLLGTLLSMLGLIYIVMKLGKGGLFGKEDHSQNKNI